VTARASTLELTCSSCRDRAHVALTAEYAHQYPLCAGCCFIVCDDCQLLGYCPKCARLLWTPPELDDERTLVVVGGSSVPGSRPSEVGAQLLCEDADDRSL
jgi:hypothetical protein